MLFPEKLDTKFEVREFATELYDWFSVKRKTKKTKQKVVYESDDDDSLERGRPKHTPPLIHQTPVSYPHVFL